MVEKIQALCREKGITLNKLEQTLGLSKSSISKWDTNAPSIDKVAKVARFFDVSVDHLLESDVDDDVKADADLPDNLQFAAYTDPDKELVGEVVSMSEDQKHDLLQLIKSMKGKK